MRSTNIDSNVNEGIGIIPSLFLDTEAAQRLAEVSTVTAADRVITWNDVMDSKDYNERFDIVMSLAESCDEVQVARANGLVMVAPKTTEKASTKARSVVRRALKAQGIDLEKSDTSKYARIIVSAFGQKSVTIANEVAKAVVLSYARRFDNTPSEHPLDEFAHRIGLRDLDGRGLTSILTHNEVPIGKFKAYVKMREGIDYIANEYEVDTETAEAVYKLAAKDTKGMADPNVLRQMDLSQYVKTAAAMLSTTEVSLTDLPEDQRNDVLERMGVARALTDMELVRQRDPNDLEYDHGLPGFDAVARSGRLYRYKTPEPHAE